MWDHDELGHTWLETVRRQFRHLEDENKRLTEELEQAAKRIRELKEDYHETLAESKENSMRL